MSYDEKAAERVRRVLAGGQDLAEKKMIGAIYFMLSGSMWSGVTGSTLMSGLDGKPISGHWPSRTCPRWKSVVAGDRLASCWSTGRATAPTRRLPNGQARHGFRIDASGEKTCGTEASQEASGSVAKAKHAADARFSKLIPY
jgi:hypothetical protein